ncbi:hypothetical protein GIB67_043282 [Kingdonia uniflora]|uniref:Uncharacterized protein n=1 Tax=Kingdonia uniflora TaxID=39325 RepID=A0A7J7PAV0_9MAGN|nr:hypothetical protein GIB67_043282 [Kingdonia uniflora]
MFGIGRSVLAMVRTRSRRQKDTEEGRLAIKIAEVEERYFGPLLVTEELPKIGVLEFHVCLRSKSRWRLIIGNCSYSTDSKIISLCSDSFGSSLVSLSNIGTEEISVLIEKAKRAKERDLEAARLQGRNRANFKAKFIKVSNGEGIDTDVDHEPQAGDRKGCNSGGGEVAEVVKEEDVECYGEAPETSEILNFKSKYGIPKNIRGQYFADCLLVFGNYELDQKDLGELLKRKCFHLALKKVYRNSKIQEKFIEKGLIKEKDELVHEKESLEAKLKKLKLGVGKAKEAAIREARKASEIEKRKDVKQIRADLAREREEVLALHKTNFEGDVQEQILSARRSMEVEHAKVLDEVKAEADRINIDSLKHMKANFSGELHEIEERKDFYKGLAVTAEVIFSDSDAKDEVPAPVLSEGTILEKVLDNLTLGLSVKVVSITPLHEN